MTWTVGDGTRWTDLPPAAFDPDTPDTPLALFPAPDPAGTPDLYDESP